MTPAQDRAYSELENALRQYHEAFEDPGILVEWVVITTITDPLEDGRDSVSTSYFSSPNQPSYRTLGLVEYASTCLRAQIAASLGELDD